MTFGTSQDTRCDPLATTADALEPILQNLINRALGRLSAVRRLRRMKLVWAWPVTPRWGMRHRRRRGVDCRLHWQGLNRKGDQQCRHGNLQNTALSR